ncbi:Cytochrome P450 7B1 [Tulasnella sp. 418]|nr:Cytochrome P450 7B1 [Tulasnella sp. 418]
MSSNATISWLTEPKKIAGYDIPPAALAVAAAALLFGTLQLTKSSKNSNAPPVVSTWVPYLGSADAIDRDPDAFLAAAKKKHPGGVFGVKIAGKIYYYVTDVKYINTVYKQPKTFSISSMTFYWAKWVFDISDKALFGSNAYPEIGEHLHRTFAPKNISPLVESYASQLYSVIQGSDEIKPAAPGTSIETPLLEFINRIAFIATSRMLFGPTFDTSDEAIAIFDAFDSQVYKASNGYPPALMPSFRKGREGIKKLFRKYMETPHQPGSFVAESHEIGRDSGWDENDLATLMLGNLWPTMANIPFSAYWAICLSLQHPEGVQPLIDELDTAGAHFMDSHPELKGNYTDHLAAFLQSSPAIPLLSSTISETLRYTTDSYSMRDVIVDQAQLGPYTVKKGDTIVCVTRGVHMDKNEFGENAEEWIPKRFMRDAPVGEDKKGVSGTETQFNWMPFGGGISMCSGRHFAQYHMKITITTLLKMFRFDVNHAKSKVKLGPTNRGFGIRRPEGDLIVKVTRL